MSKVCDKCGRGPRASASRSHSNVKTKTRQLINLQTKRIKGVKFSVCTKCIKTMAKV